MSALDKAGSQQAMHTAWGAAVGPSAPWIEPKVLERGLAAVREAVLREAKAAMCEALEAQREVPVIKVNIGPFRIRSVRWGELIDRIMMLLTGSPCPSAGP